MNNTRLKWLIVVLLCTNVSIFSLGNAKSKERARIAVMAAHTFIQTEKQQQLASKTCAAESTELTIAHANRLLDKITEDNFASILCKKDNYNLLAHLLSKKDSNVISLFTSLITESNFTEITKTKWGAFFLIMLIEKNSDVASCLTSLITAKNFTKIATTKWGAFFLPTLTKENSDMALYFTSLVTEKNFVNIAETEWGALFFLILIKENSDVASYFTSLITAKNFVNIAKTEWGACLFLKLIAKKSDVAPYLVAPYLNFFNH